MPPLNNRSYSSPNDYYSTEGTESLNHRVPYHNSDMTFSAGTSAIRERVQSSVSQGIRSRGTFNSASTYRYNCLPKSHSTTPKLPCVTQMSFENQPDSKANATRTVPEIAHKNLQGSGGYAPLSSTPRELHGTKLEESSSLRRCPRLYTCEICEKQFARPSSLTTHQFSHTGEKPHSCATCGKAFSVASNLRRHEMTLHGPRGANSTNSGEELSEATSGEFERAFLVGSTNSSIICQRGPDIFENLLPSHERFYDVNRNPPRRL